jgi:hypothetical protein
MYILSLLPIVVILGKLDLINSNNSESKIEKLFNTIHQTHTTTQMVFGQKTCATTNDVNTQYKIILDSQKEKCHDI